MYLKPEGDKLKPAFDLLCLASEVDELLKLTHEGNGEQHTLRVRIPFSKEEEPSLEFKPAKLEVISELLFEKGTLTTVTERHLKERRASCLEEF